MTRVSAARPPGLYIWIRSFPEVVVCHGRTLLGMDSSIPYFILCQISVGLDVGALVWIHIESIFGGFLPFLGCRASCFNSNNFSSVSRFSFRALVNRAI